MLSLTSIRALEAKIQKDQFIQRLDARRFRANIISESYCADIMSPPCRLGFTALVEDC